MAHEQPPRTYRVVAYVLVWALAFVFIVGLLAALFEESMGVRIGGALAATVALILGNVIARRAWPKKLAKGA